jgi:hypothetical protein
VCGLISVYLFGWLPVCLFVILIINYSAFGKSLCNWATVRRFGFQYRKLVDITSSAFYKCTATLRTQICRKCLRIKRNVSKVSYAVSLLAFSVRCRYLAVASDGWYGYGLRTSELATWHVTTVRSSHLLYIHDVFGSRNELGTSWFNTHRLLHHEARDEGSDRKLRIVSVTAELLHCGTR